MVHHKVYRTFQQNLTINFLEVLNLLHKDGMQHEDDMFDLMKSAENRTIKYCVTV